MTEKDIKAIEDTLGLAKHRAEQNVDTGKNALKAINDVIPKVTKALAELRGGGSELAQATAQLEQVTKELADTKVKLADTEKALAEALKGGGAPPKRKLRNGVSMGNSVNGYIEDVPRFIGPYVLEGGIGSLRIPIKHENIWQGGVIKEATKINGWDTKQWPRIKDAIDFCLANDVMVVLDDHKYLGYGNPDVLPFWLAMAQKLKDAYGDTDLIALEIQNESMEGGWEDEYAANVKALVTGLRDAGINYPLIIGWGGWNAAGYFDKAMTSLDAIGGPNSIDPLGKIIWSAHHYPTTSGNDRPRDASKKKPEITGSSVSGQLRDMLEGCRQRGIKCMFTEVGHGGGARGWLENGSGKPEFNGKAWLEAYSALLEEYSDVCLGSIVWGGGDGWKDDYPFKVEYAKDNWAQTRATDFWASMVRFWGK